MMPIMAQVAANCSNKVNVMDGNKGLISQLPERRVERARVAIVGAGVSGLICASTLANRGLDVDVFDKGSRPGGRLATRTTDAGEYDHGAQYIVASDSRLRSSVDSWRREGVVGEWKGQISRVDGDRRTPGHEDDLRLVGVPGMNSIAARLSGGLPVNSRSRILSADRREGRWFLQREAGEEGPFDGIVVAVPAPQAVSLLQALPSLQRQVERVRMSPCWAVLVSFASTIDTDMDGVFVDEGPLSWIANNRSKPERQRESWVLHASPDWSASHLESSPDRIMDTLLGQLAKIVKSKKLPATTEIQAHRWRYASTTEALSEPCLFDRPSAAAVCGDWCLGSRVEDAFLSGLSAAGRLLRTLDS